MNKYRKLLLTLSAIGVTLGTNAVASDKALIETLVSKGYLTQNEAAELKKGAPAIIKPKSKAVEKLTISGRLHYQYDYFNADNNGTDLANANHFYFRRLRWGAKADLGNGWSGYLNLDFAGNNLSIDEAYVGLKYDPAAQFKFGYFKVPFGLEETTSSSKIKGVERSVANRFFADDIDFAGRHAGISVAGSFDNGFSYTAMLANAAQGEDSRLGGSTSTNNSLGAFGRVQFKTKVDNTQIKVGFDAGYQADNVNNSISSTSSIAGSTMAGTAYAQIMRVGFSSNLRFSLAQRT